MKKLIVLLGFLGLFLGGAPAHGESVIKISHDRKRVAITHGVNQRWTQKQILCIYDNQDRLGCGRVIKTSKRLAILKLKGPVGNILKGDSVRAAGPQLASAQAYPETSGRRLASIQMQTTVEHDNYEYSLTGGVNVFYPQIHFQYAVGDHYTIGLLPGYYFYRIDGVESKNFGGLFTVSYYLNNLFTGPNILYGIGFYAADITFAGTESLASFSMLLTFGWRWILGKNINLGVGGGAQWFLTDKSSPVLPFRFSVLRPSVMVDIGFLF